MRCILRRTSVLAFGMAAFWCAALAHAQPAAALRIVVVEGEGAVNIVQQKSAVAPVVEVRDRNDQPVAGALVRFAVRNGRATFGGVRTVTVTTNAAGRAVAAGLAPTGSGALQISATAAFQGQTAAAVTIAQTNVMTAVQAAAASGAGAGGTGGASSAGAGAGGSGGISASTIGIVGASAAAGTIVVTKIVQSPKTYAAQFSGVLRDTHVGSNGCTQDERQSGEITMSLDNRDGPVSGTATVSGDIQLSPGTCAPDSYNTSTDRFGLDKGNLGGTAQALTMNANATNDCTTSQGRCTNSYDYAFAGSFDGTQVAGVLTIVRKITFASSVTSFTDFTTGSVTYDVVLH